jgi:hypothetical protein
LNFAKKGEYGRVIDLYARIINVKRKNSDRLQYYWPFIMTKQYGKAIKFLKKRREQDDTGY